MSGDIQCSRYSQKGVITRTFPVKLLFHAYETTYVLTPDFIELSKREISHLTEELGLYNSHIKNILKGIAPNECYSNLTDKELFFMSKISCSDKEDAPESYKHIPRGYSEATENLPFFSAVVKGLKKSQVYELDVECYEDEKETEKYWISDLSERDIIGTFLSKYTSDDMCDGFIFPMYHTILPITKKMLLKKYSEKSFDPDLYKYREDSEEYTDTERISKIAYLEKLLTDKYLTEDKKKTIREILEAKK